MNADGVERGLRRVRPGASGAVGGGAQVPNRKRPGLNGEAGPSIAADLPRKSDAQYVL